MVTRESSSGWLTTREAAVRLGVKPETLYAYVSRGLLHSQPRPGGRGSVFRESEVAALQERGRRGGRSGSLDVGIDTALTLLRDDLVAYRGLDAADAATSLTFEQVATWLWTGDVPGRETWRVDAAAIRTGRRAQASLPEHALPLDRIRVIASAVAVADELRFDTTQHAVVVAARRLLCALVDAQPLLSNETEDGFSVGGQPASRGTLAGRLWARLCERPPKPDMLAVLNAAMILQADHELSPSTLVARIAASVRANPYAVVGAALGALHGALHGGASLAIEALLADIAHPKDSAEVIGDRLRRGERLTGFGQPFHPSGDPRAKKLLGLLRRAGTNSRRLAVVDAVVQTTTARGFPPPNADFALGAFAYVAGMRQGAGEAIFAIARTAGWIAHALEEYERSSVIRPRAVYTGPSPD